MTRDMIRETLAMTRIRDWWLARDSTRDSATGKSNESRLDSHDLSTAWQWPLFETGVFQHQGCLSWSHGVCNMYTRVSTLDEPTELTLYASRRPAPVVQNTLKLTENSNLLCFRPKWKHFRPLLLIVYGKYIDNRLRVCVYVCVSLNELYSLLCRTVFNCCAIQWPAKYSTYLLTYFQCYARFGK